MLLNALLSKLCSDQKKRILFLVIHFLNIV